MSKIIRDAIEHNSLRISWHAMQRMKQRKIDESKIKCALMYGRIVECSNGQTLEAKVRHGALNVVIALRQHTVTVMTAY